MDYVNVSTVEFERFVLVLLRVGALLMSAPLFSASAVPKMVKVGLSVAVSLALLPVVGPGMLISEIPMLQLAALGTSEVLLGVSMGLLARLFIAAVDMGAEIMGFQMGFGIVTAIDPSTRGSTALLSQFQGVITALIILATDTHHIIFRAIRESFTRIPLMGFSPTGNLWAIFIETSSKVFTLALKFAAPTMVVLMLTSVALGIVARTVPQMNVFIVGMSVQIVVGFVVLLFSASMIGILYAQTLTDMATTMIRFTRAF
jgi:flagellar biosynthetic protein FliR